MQVGGPSLALLVALSACRDGSHGGDDAGPAPQDAGRDAGGDRDAADDGGDGGQEIDELDPTTELAGMVRLVEATDSASVTVRFTDAAMSAEHERVAGGAVCALYEPLDPAFCDPPCAVDRFCRRDGTCTPYPQRVSAGAVRIDGPGWSALATHDESAWYTVEGAPEDDLFGVGDSISIEAEGGEVPAFARTLEGLGAMEPAIASLRLVDGRDNEVRFTPQGDGARIELVVQTGWHGAPAEAIVWCVGADADGSIVVPRDLVERFPPAGGEGLFPHPSYLRRVRRRLVEGPFGTIEVLLANELSFGLTH